ncbi:MAG: acetate--CoA ligase family protein [Patescibacteria group bacterium]
MYHHHFEYFSQNEKRIYEPASLYKLWVLGAAFKQIKEGKLNRNEIISRDVKDLNEIFDIASDSAELTEGTVTMKVSDARVFLERSQVWSVLKGTRGQTFATDSLQKLIANLSNFIAERPEVQSIDCNPVLVSHSTATILDARLTFQQ